MREVIVVHDREELNHLAVEKFVEIFHDSVNARGKFFVALSGGSTPRDLFRLLTSADHRNEVDWSRIFFFFGDERNVSIDSSESNFRMASENLFEPLGIDAKNIFRWKTELSDPVSVADEYESSLKLAFGSDEPIFDLIFLGMGPDGHTASLFPETSALKETARIAVANAVPQMNTIRFTLTFGTINAARNVIFLVSGSDKSEMVAKILDSKGGRDTNRFPSSGIEPSTGHLYWLLDEQAAKDLSS